MLIPVNSPDNNFPISNLSMTLGDTMTKEVGRASVSDYGTSDGDLFALIMGIVTLILLAFWVVRKVVA